jgi:hypothetical protein
MSIDTRRNEGTHGNNESKASVIPKPARKTGVSPILGLMLEPVKGPTGVCYMKRSPKLVIKYTVQDEGRSTNIPR